MRLEMPEPSLLKHSCGGGGSLTIETERMQSSRLQPGSFLGQTLKSYRAGHLHLIESRYGSQFQSATHSHEHAFCYLVLEGTCTETCGNRTRTCMTSYLPFH